MIELLLTLFVTLLGGSEPIFEFEFGIHIHNQGFHETENAHHLEKHQFKWSRRYSVFCDIRTATSKNENTRRSFFRLLANKPNSKETYIPINFCLGTDSNIKFSSNALHCIVNGHPTIKVWTERVIVIGSHHHCI